jgi:single-strand DNA-binding protein
MSNFNQVILLGRLTRDPELKTLSSGSNVVEFGLVVNDYYNDKDGNRQEQANFIECQMWGQRAQTVANGFKKGSRIHVIGSLKYETWEDKQSGGKRSRLSVKVDDFNFIDKKQSEDESNDLEEQKPRQRQPQQFGNKGAGFKKNSEIPF